MNSHPTFPTPTWYPSAATWVFIQGLNLLCTNMCLGFHQALAHQHPAQLSVLTQQKKRERKEWSWGGVPALRRWSRWRTKASSGHPEGMQQHTVVSAESGHLTHSRLSLEVDQISFSAFTKVPPLACCWYGLFLENSVCLAVSKPTKERSTRRLRHQ